MCIIVGNVHQFIGNCLIHLVHTYLHPTEININFLNRKSANSNDDSASCANKSSKQINENNKSLVEVVNLDNTDSTVELSDEDDSIAEVSRENYDDLEMEDCESNPAVQLNSDAFISEIAQNEEVS